jgi:hypothetical protein
MKGHKSHHHGKHKASGGRTEMKVSGNPDVFKEAEEKKKGGRVGKHVGSIHGKHPAHRMDRPGRKSGGRVGADRSPLSSAHGVSSPAKDGETDHNAAD